MKIFCSPFFWTGTRRRQFVNRLWIWWPAWGCLTRSKRDRPSFPAASASAWRSQGRWLKNLLWFLADEPTANLDAENSYQVLELMRALNKQLKAAFIFSTHDEKVTKYVNREVGLEDGRVCWDKRRNGAGSLE